ncbi:MAG TPA: hypothetical protein VLF94_07300 [Chlamydiales bacterium]|nr:hypothetical protein [Chlamydiales bacterium]
MLDFLQRDVARRCAEEGFDAETDPQLQKLLKGISPSSELFSLSEIVDDYQHLFGARGPVHLEKKLMEAFPVADFVALGLIRYYPRMYRGLPRLYTRESPSVGQIKRNFTHLPTLKKQAVSRALFSLYSKFPAKGKVSLFTYVMNDGLGDYAAAADAVRILKGRFPELEIHLIALVPSKTTLPAEGAWTIPYEGECPISLIAPEMLALLRSSDLIIQMPTYYPHTAELLTALQKIDAPNPVPKMELVGEYGFVESSWFHPKSGGYSMGLHFLEKGILIRKLKQAQWSDIKNEQLRMWLNPDNHFYLAYLATPMGGAIYLHALLKSLENDPRDIDLCVPDLGWLIQFVERQTQLNRPILEWELGVSSIEVEFNGLKSSISLAPSGKKVRLFCPGQLAQSDFQALLTLSGNFVAVRGNQSLTEAISIGKSFFYDGQSHARCFMKDLVALAENRISDHPTTLACIRGMNQSFLSNQPIEGETWVDETFFQEREEWTSTALSIGLALQDPDVAVGFKKLGQIVAAEFSANTFLCHLVQRDLCHRSHPHIEKQEAKELSLFTSDSQTFSQLILNLARALKE